jgi:uncharacterized protein
MMRRLGGAIFACVLLMTPALGQQGGSPDALQAARELQAVMSGDLVKQMVDQMMTAMWPGVENQFRAKVNAATLTDIRAEFQRVMLKYVLTVQDEAPAVYAKYFSAEELRSLSAFYRTPVGIKALSVMPKVMGESMQIMVTRMPDLEKELTASIESVNAQERLPAAAMRVSSHMTPSPFSSASWNRSGAWICGACPRSGNSTSLALGMRRAAVRPSSG